MEVYSRPDVSRLGEGGAFRAPTCQATTTVYSEPKSFCHNERPAFGKVLLWAGFYLFINFKLVSSILIT
jgi:hypothetical protein